MAKGKLIVIDGSDGSGKATQTELLLKRLIKEGKKVKKIDFPRYKDNFFGGLLRQCLDGDYGDFIAIPPKIASTLYAADRWESSGQIKKWLDAGYSVIADRYASANQMHQGGKISDEKGRREFLKWLDKMEFEIFKIPRPDIVLYLNVPVVIGQKLLAVRSTASRGAKAKQDLAEANVEHLENSQKSAMAIVKKSNNWHKIDCSRGGEILPREVIHELIYKQLKKNKKI